jgi:hypothetical protein
MVIRQITGANIVFFENYWLLMHYFSSAPQDYFRYSLNYSRLSQLNATIGIGIVFVTRRLDEGKKKKKMTGS